VSGLILRLAGPLQSWGEHSTFNVRDTSAFPTRSGILGMLAAAQGLPRAADLEHYAPLEITVRMDRPGRRLVDFHTVGGGLPRRRTVRTAAGGHRPEGTTTLVSHRHYLADAVFTVGIHAPGPGGTELIGALAAALRRPAWAPYLGRRSCVPDLPLLLRTGVEDIDAELRTRAPLARTRDTRQDGPVKVDMLYERPPQDLDARASTYELMDIPDSFASHDRRYQMRRLYRCAPEISSPQYIADETAGLDRLTRYAKEGAA
jgi:CRISPR system Cascade subunit CasD